MSFVVLLRGEPGNGKSTGSSILLDAGCFDKVLRTDELYVTYIRDEKKALNRENLGQIILGHYNEFRHEIEPHWHEHLTATVKSVAQSVRRLLVEGWQLTHCYSKLSESLEASGHTVHHVLASNKRYLPDAPPSKTICELAEWVRSVTPR